MAISCRLMPATDGPNPECQNVQQLQPTLSKRKPSGRDPGAEQGR